MGDDDVTVTGSVRATRAAIEPAVDAVGAADDLARFALSHSLRDVFLVVPWTGAEVSRASALLRGEGLAVTAVGTDPRWITDPRPLMQWIRRVRLLGSGVVGPLGPDDGGEGSPHPGGGLARGGGVGPAHADEGGAAPVDRAGTLTGDEGGAGSEPGPGVFTGVHLDVEPWRLPVWDRDRLRATRGLVTLVRHARALVPDLPLSADLPHWLAAEPYWPPPEEGGVEDVQGTLRPDRDTPGPVPGSVPGRGTPPGPGPVPGRGTPPGRGEVPGPAPGPRPGQAVGVDHLHALSSDVSAPGPAPDRPSGARGGAAASPSSMGARLQERPRIREMGGTGQKGVSATTGAGPRGERGWTALVDEPGMPTVRSRAPAGVAAPRRSRRSVFEAMLDHLDSVVILVPRTRAHGQGGILDASARARAACIQHGVTYMIGLETRPTTDPRHPRATFHDAGALALAREVDRLREALGTDPHFLGVAVHDWAAWRLLD